MIRAEGASSAYLTTYLTTARGGAFIQNGRMIVDGVFSPSFGCIRGSTEYIDGARRINGASGSRFSMVADILDVPGFSGKMDKGVAISRHRCTLAESDIKLFDQDVWVEKESKILHVDGVCSMIHFSSPTFAGDGCVGISFGALVQRMPRYRTVPHLHVRSLH